MNSPPIQEALVPFLGLGRDAEGLPSVVPIIPGGTEFSLQAPLLFPSVKEQKAIEQGKESITRTLGHPPTSDGSPSPPFARYQQAAGVLPAILRLEQCGAADGHVGSGFASVEPDGRDVLLRLYLHINNGQPTGTDFSVQSLPSEVAEKVNQLNLRVFGTKISSADFQLLDGVYHRVVLHCALSGLRTLFVKLREKGEGLNAGVSRLLRSDAADRTP